MPRSIRPSRALLVVLPLVGALVAACGDSPVAPGGPGGPGPVPPVASVSVGPAELALEVGGSAALTATPRDAAGAPVAGHTIVWSSSDTLVAAVSEAGLVTARGIGTATVRATSAGRAGAVTVAVGRRPVTWIQIVPGGLLEPLAVGATRPLAVVARAADGTETAGWPVAWTSSDTTVATVGADGVVLARRVGTATIVAVAGGRRDSTIVGVPSLIARVVLDAATFALDVLDARTLVATARDAAGTPLARTFTWSTSNPAVAVVDAAGRVTATGAGTAVVTATSEGRQATAVVTVAGEAWRLARVAGAPLPAILYETTVSVGGAERAARFQATGATLRLLAGRYDLRVDGWLLVDGAVPVAMTHAAAGVLAYDVFTGAPLLTEGDDWHNRPPRFRTRLLDDGRLELAWSREPGMPTVPLTFAR